MGSAIVLLDNGLHLVQYEVKMFLESQEKARKRKLEYLIS